MSLSAHIHRTASLALAAASVLAVSAACSSTPRQSGSDLPTAAESSHGCGTAAVDVDALVRYRTEAVIDASPSAIWGLLTDVSRWPTWVQSVQRATGPDPAPLSEGSHFEWTTPVPATELGPATDLVVTSTVERMESESCIVWSGPAVGDGLMVDNGVHMWTLADHPDGVLVSTEESWVGEQVESDAAMSTGFLGASLDAWLADLKTAAEAQS